MIEVRETPVGCAKIQMALSLLLAWRVGRAHVELAYSSRGPVAGLVSVRLGVGWLVT